MTETSTYTHQELSARLAEVERERDEALAMVGRLLHITKELHGGIKEYQELPCKSLEKRMFGTSDRYLPAVNRLEAQQLRNGASQ